MKEQIRQRALELGFDACRFTTASPPPHAAEFQRWLAGGRHGEMGYLERNAAKRIAPDLVLADAKSIVTLAVSYATPEAVLLDDRARPSLSPSGERARVRGSSEISAGSSELNGPESSAAGLIARYARFNDYHKIIGGKLEQLTSFVDSFANRAIRSLWYVDTGPFLERDLAERSGLGFIGKHTNLISRSLGNWLFLGEIITRLPIEPDPAEKNRCGSCTRCISACPTGAITAPFQLDARRCISYLTIELKGSIPTEFRRSIGNRIYGCDDCLVVCPWNRFAREGRMMKSHARPDLRQIDLLELLSLDEVGFKKRFAGTPILRTKRRGLLRNVCVALGNVGNESALPALARAALDPEPLIAEHAAWAIEEIEQRMGEVTV